MAKTDFTAQRLRDLLHYEPKTGVFTWLVNRQGPARAGDKAGYVRHDKYLIIGLHGKTYLAHRLAWLYCYGDWPKHDIDHIDGDPSNNSMANLRDEPTQINLQNIKKATKKNLTGLLGVSPSRNKKSWYSRIYIDGQLFCLGTYDSAQDAYAAYVKAKRAGHIGCTI